MPGGGAQRVGKGSRNRRNLSNIVPLAERDGKQLVLSCAYKGKTFKASVLPSGEINFGQDLRFSSPSSWVLHCGRTVKPTLQSINGWNAVGHSEATKRILDELRAGKQPKTGSQLERYTCEPLGGLTSLTHQEELRAQKVSEKGDN